MSKEQHQGLLARAARRSGYQAGHLRVGLQVGESVELCARAVAALTMEQGQRIYPSPGAGAAHLKVGHHLPASCCAPAVPGQLARAAGGVLSAGGVGPPVLPGGDAHLCSAGGGRGVPALHRRLHPRAGPRHPRRAAGCGLLFCGHLHHFWRKRRLLPAQRHQGMCCASVQPARESRCSDWLPWAAFLAAGTSLPRPLCTSSRHHLLPTHPLTRPPPAHPLLHPFHFARPHPPVPPHMQGVVIAVVGGVFAGALTVLRFRLPSIGPGLVITIFTIAVLSFAPFWYPVVKVQMAW